jgi:hypothetical protein
MCSTSEVLTDHGGVAEILSDEKPSDTQRSRSIQILFDAGGSR